MNRKMNSVITPDTVTTYEEYQVRAGSGRQVASFSELERAREFQSVRRSRNVYVYVYKVTTITELVQ